MPSPLHTPKELMAQMLCLLHVATGQRPPLQIAAVESFAAGMSAEPASNPDQVPPARSKVKTLRSQTAPAPSVIDRQPQLPLDLPLARLELKDTA
jgi:hypothetical protein